MTQQRHSSIATYVSSPLDSSGNLLVGFLHTELDIVIMQINGVHAAASCYHSN